MQWCRSVLAFIGRLLRLTTAPRKTVRLSELPDDLDQRFIYLIGEGGHQWFAAMVCPCGCGKTIYLNLDPNDRPCWKMIEHGGGIVSISPSIHRRVGCRSHFWVQCGYIIWHGDDR